MKRYIATVMAILGFAASGFAQTPTGEKLSGNVIGTDISVDYYTGVSSTTVNTKYEAFDGDLNTCFASYDRSFTWVGMELDQPYIITGVGISPRNDGLGPGRLVLGVFQGANNADFSDALPIFMVTEKGVIGEMKYYNVDCSRGFRYVRYVGPHDARCNVAEIEFYGIPGEGDDSSLYQPTNLPLVVVNTPGMEWFHENDKSYELNGSQIAIINEGVFDVDAPGQIRGRGNASWNFPKKPFRIKFDKKQTVLGGPAKAKKWTMINNYGDKTLMRNKLAFDISKRLNMAFTPSCHFVDLIFNGEYQGTYQLCDQVEVNKNRVNITEMEATDIEGEALTGGYLVEIDAYANEEPADEWFYSQGGHYIPVTIKSPDPGVTQQYNYILSRFSEMEKAVFAYDFTDPEKGYRSKLDLDSFLKHFIVGELAGNTDTYWSVYMSLDRGADKFTVGPVWDFDLGFDNDYRTYPVNNRNDFVCFSGGSFANGMYDFVRQIIKNDPDAAERLSEIWSVTRNRGILSEEAFDGLVTEYSNQLQESQKLNFQRWPILGERVHMNPQAKGSYDAEVGTVRNYLKNRFAKLDKLIGRVPTDVDAISYATETTFRVENGNIHIENEGEFTIYNMQGIKIAAGNKPASVAVAPGCYIVRTPHGAVKISVR